ncbi:MAG: DUF177 domain-containing protein [candidate division NC10 bacterium]|nr:DUF177 domain-containing protein [candidate division NC10 bacterium]
MFVEISQIPAEGLDLLYQGDLPEREGLWEPKTPVRASLHLEKREKGVVVSGTFSTVVGLSCSRCSDPVLLPVEDAFEIYLTPPSRALDENLELTPGELDVEFLEGDKINVLGLIVENILLSLPWQPLCREDCRGLCPRCGQNLNEVSCNCHEEEIDPRLALLKKLL